MTRSPRDLYVDALDVLLRSKIAPVARAQDWELLREKDLPPRSTVNGYFSLWDYDGTLDRIHHALYVKCRDQAEREASPTAAIIDSQSVKSAEKGGRASIRMAEPVLGPAEGWTRGTPARRSPSTSSG